MKHSGSQQKRIGDEKLRRLLCVENLLLESDLEGDQLLEVENLRRLLHAELRDLIETGRCANTALAHRQAGPLRLGQLDGDRLVRGHHPGSHAERHGLAIDPLRQLRGQVQGGANRQDAQRQRCV